MQAEFERLARDVAQLMAERDIVHRLYRYDEAIDEVLPALFLDCFTDDAVFLVVGDHGPAPRRVVGREQLAEYIGRQRRRVPGAMGRHIYANPRVTVEGDTASAEGYYFSVQSVDSVPEVRGFGVYRDRLRRCSDGAWRISERVLHGDATPWHHRRDPPEFIRPFATALEPPGG